MLFSVIIPVYNRPEELRELLYSLTCQTQSNFEVIVVEDGSGLKAEEVCHSFQKELRIQYVFQKNSGQGFARNKGMELAKGDFYILFDSDVVVPDNYFFQVENAILERNLDAFGGPDAAAKDFSILQKAMDFAMTSFWTTGGIRGKMKDPAKYQARGFNMGVSKAVFEKTGGFLDPNQGEDIEWSIRIKKAGFRLELVKEAFVFHKRKNTLWSFSKQAFSFGRNRINVSRFHPDAIQIVHLMPSLFLAFLISLSLTGMLGWRIFMLQFLVFSCWVLAVWISATFKTKSFLAGLLAIVTSILQLSAYGLGFIWEFLVKIFKG
ncbi:glycosyltransferase [Algoriphagus kandeliae]|uniref:Glycosyltransferase n=1 Tax=Algoriphagus kandeliae TaxID=2562278 RepID=A0A4Y9QR52_9BACT|nr:glycosyltransferase [Algoriphagus kandeliae]TFV94760.1 glycosyltransferase [Algoriphagus kandeliae]